ncbi:cytochrome c oxidase accessory protein CcoG [Henriciella sp. AS95]|uniref:cytochrome c oxidase accessory protein CcoG n=1 Tax=Henriciella sp. AS95 TaxID=3135782 RepID=UPI003176B8E3
MSRVTLITPKSPPPAPPPQDLYSKRKQIYPKLAHGKFRTLKWAAMAVMLGVYYLVPWLRWPRGAGVPDQAVLADFAGERFFFFGIEIWPQEAYYLAGLMILAALGLFLVTSLFGRVWCGYACPQTVWTDLYIWVERAFEGDRAARIRLDKKPWSFDKAWRKIGKHIVWLLIAFLTGGAFILYFHDARMIAETFFIGEAPLSAYWFAGILTFTTYALAGTMREQVCTYLCPWPRIQGALTDEHALNVTYRYDRGEPRGPHRKGESWDGRGDCIDCKQCVQVCPMGIDIRDGAQLECIHCALCIDACDDIMKKIDRPTGLIAYDTDTAVACRASGQKPKYRLIRPRTILYFVVMVMIASVMAFGLLNRGTFEVNVLKDRSPPYIQLSDGDIRNGYTLKLVNKSGDARSMSLEAHGMNGLVLDVTGLEPNDEGIIMLPVAAHGVDRYRLSVSIPEESVDGRRHFFLLLTDVNTGEVHTNRTSFMAPAN